MKKHNLQYITSLAIATVAITWLGMYMQSFHRTAVSTSDVAVATDMLKVPVDTCFMVDIQKPSLMATAAGYRSYGLFARNLSLESLLDMGWSVRHDSLIIEAGYYFKQALRYEGRYLHKVVDGKHVALIYVPMSKQGCILFLNVEF